MTGVSALGQSPGHSDTHDGDEDSHSGSDSESRWTSKDYGPPEENDPYLNELDFLSGEDSQDSAEEEEEVPAVSRVDYRSWNYWSETDTEEDSDNGKNTPPPEHPWDQPGPNDIARGDSSDESVSGDAPPPAAYNAGGFCFGGRKRTYQGNTWEEPLDVTEPDDNRATNKRKQSFMDYLKVCVGSFTAKGSQEAIWDMWVRKNTTAALCDVPIYETLRGRIQGYLPKPIIHIQVRRISDQVIITELNLDRFPRKKYPRCDYEPVVIDVQCQVRTVYAINVSSNVSKMSLNNLPVQPHRHKLKGTLR